jgi:paraquat-inducible protein B
LQQAVRELTGTARAIRTLANYLDQHPEALLRGRDGELNEERQ